MIYKYFKVNEHSISNLVRNELFCQNVKAFNDPFECWFILKEGIPDPEKDVDRFKSACETWGYTPEKTTMEEYFIYMEEMETNQPDIKRYVEQAKISCFSKEVDNLLMWAHYADGMRGFCIEYDEKELLSKDSEGKATIIPVVYTENPPVVDKIIYSLADDQIWFNEMALEEEGPNRDYRIGLKEAKKIINDLYTRTIATKPKQWKYEKEIRLIFDSEKDSSIGEFFHFPPDSIKSIIFGELMNVKDRETLLQIIEMKNLSIKKKIAKKIPGSYQIEFENIN